MGKLIQLKPRKLLLCLLCFSKLAFSGSMGDVEAPSSWIGFVGIGGGYNTVQFKQSLYGWGIADYSGNVVGSGAAQGPAGIYYESVPVFSPEVVAGFQKNFVDSNRFLGIKFSYQYLGAAAIHQNFNVIQEGVVNGATLSGNIIVESSQLKLNHEMLLLPFIGHSFKNTEIHFGIGPALFGTTSQLNGVIGFANVFSSPLDISGAPAGGVLSTKWLIAGAAEVGGSYYFSKEYRLDVNYTYAISEQYVKIRPSSFVNTLSNAGITITGTGAIKTTQNMAAQALTFTINRVFTT